MFFAVWHQWQAPYVTILIIEYDVMYKLTYACIILHMRRQYASGRQAGFMYNGRCVIAHSSIAN